MNRVNSHSGSALLRWQYHKHCRGYYYYYYHYGRIKYSRTCVSNTQCVWVYVCMYYTVRRQTIVCPGSCSSEWFGVWVQNAAVDADWLATSYLPRCNGPEWRVVYWPWHPAESHDALRQYQPLPQAGTRFRETKGFRSTTVWYVYNSVGSRGVTISTLSSNFSCKCRNLYLLHAFVGLLKNAFAARALPRTLPGAYSAFPDPLTSGEGTKKGWLFCPKNPNPALNLQPRFLAFWALVSLLRLTYSYACVYNDDYLPQM